MSNLQNKPTQGSTLQNTQKNQKPNFFRKIIRDIKLVVGLGFIPGFIGGGYFVYNADTFNIPFLAKGTHNSQDVDIKKGTIDENNPGNIGTNSGNQAGAGNSGTVGNDNTNNTGNSGISGITVGDNANIDIKITPQDPNFQNINLPGYFPEKGFASKPPELTDFEGAKVFTQDLVVSGRAFFTKDEIIINNRGFKAVFYLNGLPQEARKVAFKLNGRQRAALLQFGLSDLTEGDTNLTYQVNIFADGRKAWSGQVIYGTSQQLLSVPVELPGATTLVIEYQVSQGTANRNLIFTRAELLYK